MPEDEKQEAGGQDPFILETVFPDAKTILRTPPDAEEVVANCVYVLDANAMLAPYAVGKDGFKDVAKVLEKAAKENRILIPAHALREFAKHRANKIANIHTHLSQLNSQIPATPKVEVPLLEDTEELKRLAESVAEITTAIKKYRSCLQAVLDYVQSLNWNDPVSRLYATVFPIASIIEHGCDVAELKADSIRRNEGSIPPGYKDKGKAQNRAGDLLIWKTVLRIGKDRQTNVVFVTNDEKADWYVGSAGTALFGRYELVDEFFRHTGHHLMLMTYDRFLKRIGAQTTTVEAIRDGRGDVFGTMNSTKRRLATDAIRADLSTSAARLAAVYDQIADGNIGVIFTDEFSDPAWDFMAAADTLEAAVPNESPKWLHDLAACVLSTTAAADTYRGELLSDDVRIGLESTATSFLSKVADARNNGLLYPPENV